MQLLTHSILLRALGWWLLDSLWQLGLLWLLYTLFTLIFRKASAGVRHGMALLLLGAGTCWSGFSLIDHFISGVPSNASLGSLFLPAGQYPFYNFLARGNRLIGEALPYCSTLYLVTLSFLFIRYISQYLHSRRLRGTELSRIQPEFRVFTEQTSRRMGIRRDVNVWFSSLVEGPLTLGFVKPVILLPLAMAANLSTQQVEAILLHELAHIRQNDYLLNLGVTALEVLFFFNPFARLLIRRIKREREHRCDDVVIQFRYDPHAYASALLSLAANMQSNSRLVLAATGSNDRLLLQRVKRILKIKHTGDRPAGRSLLFLFLPFMAAVLILSGSPFAGGHETGAMLEFSLTEAEATAAPAVQTPDASSVPARLATEPNSAPAGTPANVSTGREANQTIILRPEASYPATIPVVKPRHRLSAVRIRTAPFNNIVVVNYDDAKPTNDENNARFVNQETSSQVADGDEHDKELIAKAVALSKREYSFGVTVAANTGEDIQPQCAAAYPYVPNASFLYQSVQDSTAPAEQYAYLQEAAVKQVEIAVMKMHKQLQYQLKVMQKLSSKEKQQALDVRKQILMQQLKLQEQYLQQQHELQQKLERAKNKRVIVVI